jgi:hypothetical protein
LNYAMHSFPAQGATVHASATLAGHWSQAKRETYVGDTRAIYRHSVHVAREDLGTNGTDQDRIDRYAQRIAADRQRHASIRSAVNPTLRLAIDLPSRQPLPLHKEARHQSAGPREISATTSAAGHTKQQQHACPGDHRKDVLSDPPEHLQHALGPPPTEPVARERWEREAQRLQALPAHTGTRAEPAPSPPAPVAGATSAPPPPHPVQTISQRRVGPTIGR